MAKIREIVGLLETRVDELLTQFRALENTINEYLREHPFVQMEDEEELKPVLNGMVDIFQELRPIERLIRFKFKEYGMIFDKLTQILDERENGKFFAFLAHSPLQTKRPYTKRQVLTVTPNPEENQSTLG